MIDKFGALFARPVTTLTVMAINGCLLGYNFAMGMAHGFDGFRIGLIIALGVATTMQWHVLRQVLNRPTYY